MATNNFNLNIKTVFVDIDTTLTDPRPGTASDPQSDPLTKLVAKNNGITMDEAICWKRKAENTVSDMVGHFWPFGILGQLNVSEDELWEAYESDAKEKLFMHPDAKTFLVGLKERWPLLKVHTATTNPRLIIYAKLALAGLAGQDGSPYLDCAFGGEEIYPGGKTCSEFYTALLKRTDSNPETTLMVGDCPKMDLALAKAAGIDQVAISRRDQEEDWVYEPDGGLYVKRLDYILDLIK